MTYRMLPNAVHFKEFQNDPVTGTHYTATCGETMLATMMVCATPQTETTAQAISLMESITRAMMAEHIADAPEGATTMGHLHDYAIAQKFVIDASSYVSFHQPLDPTTLHNLLLSTAGIKPIGLEIATAGAGLPGDEAGVHYHFICIVGISDTGYICNDGDNWQINQQLVTYSWDEIEKATPCAVMVMELQEGAYPVGVPNGWSDDGKTLSNPTTSFVVTGGFREFVLNNSWNPADVPVAAVERVDEVEVSNTSWGPGVIQLFRLSQLSLPDETANPAKHVVFKSWTGAEINALREKVAADTGQISTLESQITQLQAEINQLQQQQLKLDPAIPNALSAALNLLQPYETVAGDVRDAIGKLPH